MPTAAVTNIRSTLIYGSAEHALELAWPTPWRPAGARST